MDLAAAFGLLTDLRHRGFVVQSKGERIRVAPSGELTPQVRELLSRGKPGLLRALSLEERILKMPLDLFEQQGCPIEVRVPWLPQTLWFVPGEMQVEASTRRGISRGRIWTARELMLLWRLPSLDGKTVEKLGSIKAQLDGEILSVEGPAEGAAENAKS